MSVYVCACILILYLPLGIIQPEEQAALVCFQVSPGSLVLRLEQGDKFFRDSISSSVEKRVTIVPALHK